MRSVLRMFFIFIILLITVRSYAKESIAPFLYYYSPDDAAFIIERADGADRRQLVAYKLAEDYFAVGGPGWSQSGKWFAWYSNKYNANFDMVNTVYIVSRNGKVTEAFGGLGLITKVSWSPVEDLLYFEEQGGYGPTRAYIYDTRQDEINELKETKDSQSFLQPTWSPDGNYLLRPYVEDNKTYLQVFLKNGKPYLAREIYIWGQEGIWDGYYHSCIVPRWTPHNDLMYMSNRNELIIEDLSTGSKQSYEFSEGNLGWVDWSPDGNYALIFTVRQCFGSSIEITGEWLLSQVDNRVTYLSDVYAVPEVYTGYPELFSYISKELWTSDSQRFVYVDQGRHIKVVEVPSFETDVVWSMSEGSQGFYERLEFFWSSNEDLFWFDGHWTLNHYNVNSGLQSTQLGTYTGAGTVRFSPDFEHIAVKEYSCGHTCIVSLSSEEPSILKFGKHDTSNVTSGYIWHEDSEWLFVISQHSGLSVLRVEFGHFRNLPFSAFGVNPSAFGWLPDVAQ